MLIVWMIVLMMSQALPLTGAEKRGLSACKFLQRLFRDPEVLEEAAGMQLRIENDEFCI